MSTTTTFPFTTPSNYSFTATDIKVDAGEAGLLIQEAAQVFNEDFVDDTGHTYDSGEAEFTGGLVRQIELAPAGAIFGANYSAGIDANWSGGVLTGTATNGAAVVSGKLDLSHFDIRYVEYAGVGNADFLVQTGTLKARVTPAYSGTPTGTHKVFLGVLNVNGSKVNRIQIQHNVGTGQLTVIIAGSNGTDIMNVGMGVWNPTSGTEYEIELNYDVTAGATRLFVDGVQLGTTKTQTGTRSSAISFLRIGAGIAGTSVSNFDIQDVALFSTVQHTAGYTPDYVVPDDKFAETDVILPEFAHIGAGSILTLTSLVTTEVGAAKYTIQMNQSGNYLYWDGAAWSTSDGTYAQATSKTDFNTNIAAIPVSGDIYVQIKTHFGAQSTATQSVADLTLNHTGNNGYLTTDPTVLVNTTITATSITGFTATTTETGSDLVKYTLCVDSQDRYWTGSAWADSNGTYAQSSTVSEINNNAATLITARATIKIRSFLHSDDGSTTPTLDVLTITYDAADIAAAEPLLVYLEGYIYDNNGPVATQAVEVRSATGHISDEIFVLREWNTLATTDSAGYFFGHIWASAGILDYELRLNSNRYSMTIPNQATVNLSDLVLTRITS